MLNLNCAYLLRKCFRIGKKFDQDHCKGLILSNMQAFIEANVKYICQMLVKMKQGNHL